jgi:hypothetical protein
MGFISVTYLELFWRTNKLGILQMSKLTIPFVPYSVLVADSLSSCSLRSKVIDSFSYIWKVLKSFDSSYPFTVLEGLPGLSKIWILGLGLNPGLLKAYDAPSD